MKPYIKGILSLLFSALFLSAFAQEIDTENQGYQKMVDTLDQKWNDKDLKAITDWFNSADEAKSIIAQNLLKKPESTFKQETVLAYLGGSPRSWGDLDPAAPPPSALSGTTRMGLIGACINTIKLAAPGLEISESDFQTREDRSKLAERFSKSLNQSKSNPPPAPNQHEEANPDLKSDSVANAKIANEAESKTKPIPVPGKKIAPLWLRIGLGTAALFIVFSLGAMILKRR